MTESRRIDDPNEAVAILKPLRNAGIRIALDDFGMGYAGLRQLQHMKTLPVDVLKIDKAFVDGLPDDSSPGAGHYPYGTQSQLACDCRGHRDGSSARLAG